MKKFFVSGILALTAMTVLLLGCSAQKEQVLTAEDITRQVNESLSETQAIIDRHWPQLVAKRQQCEASCTGNECPCLSGLKADEQQIIMMMIGHADMWNRFNTLDRKFCLHYGWQLQDQRATNDLKELLLALREDAFVKDGSLGLTIIGHVQEEDIPKDLAVVFQEVYAAKKIPDIQAYLKSVRLLYSTVTDAKFPVEPMALPYFILTQLSSTENGAAYVIFHASVYDPVFWKDFPNKKYPWSESSINALILVTDQH